jgi:uncharacterized protein YqgV (UPF0045/DUF77 family)
MIATIEISMYALTDGYEEKVIDFIQRIKKNKEIRVEVGGLSTMLYGEYNLLMQVVKEEMKHDFENGKAVFILKIAGSELTKEKLPDSLK